MESGGDQNPTSSVSRLEEYTEIHVEYFITCGSWTVSLGQFGLKMF